MCASLTTISSGLADQITMRPDALRAFTRALQVLSDYTQTEEKKPTHSNV